MSCNNRHPGWDECEESILLGGQQEGPVHGTTTVPLVALTTTTTTNAPTTTTTTAPATTTTTTAGCPQCTDIIYNFE